MLNLPKEMVEAVLADWTRAAIPERTRAALSVIEAMTLRPETLDVRLLDDARRAGVDDVALQGVTSITFQFNFMNRVADAFDFERPNAAQALKLAKLLNRASSLFQGTPERVPFVVGEDGVLRPEALEKGRQRLLRVPGVVEPSVRRAAEAFVTRAWGVERKGAPALEPVWEPYLSKLAKHAFRIVDDDLEALRGKGFTNEMIYEVTIAGCVGAALVGVEAVLRARFGASR